MAINFPNSPSDGDTHTVGTTTWTFDSTTNSWESGVATPANTSTSSGSYTAANTTLTMTRADASTFDIDLSNIESLPSTISLENTSGTANAAGTNSISIGASSNATGVGSVAIGINSKSTEANTITLGTSSFQVNVPGDLMVDTGLRANGSYGTAGQVLQTDGDKIYWATSSGLPSTISLENTTASASATGANSIAIGANATTGSANAIVIGVNANGHSGANGDNVIVIGKGAGPRAAGVDGDGGIAIGNGAQFYENAIAIGENAYPGQRGVTIGASANGGSDATVVGSAARGNRQYAVALGASSNASGANYAIAIGYRSNNSSSPSGIAIGPFANVSIANSIAIGYGAQANTTDAHNGVAIGMDSKVTTANTVMLGGPTWKTINGGDGSANGVTISDALIEMRSGTGSPAQIDMYCESTNAHKASLKAPDHAVFSGDTVTTLPIYDLNLGMVAVQNTTGTACIVGTNDIAFGPNSRATGQNGIAIGYEANTNRNRGVAVGAYSTVAGLGSDSIAIGGYAKTDAGSCAALGGYARANKVGATAVGVSSNADFDYSVSLGYDSEALANYSMALGAYASANVANTIVLGTENHLSIIPGQLTVGDEVSNTYALYVDGDVYATGDVTSASDEKLKTNIKTVDNALDSLDNIRGVKYSYIETGKPSIGVIAQEVQKEFPELVAEDDTLGVNYNGLIGVLIQAVKELRQEVDELKNGRV